MADDHVETANPLLYSVAWKQTAAEYQALYYQGFNIARMHVELALAKHKKGDKPLAIISDFDDTLVLPLDYWAMLVDKNIDFSTTRFGMDGSQKIKWLHLQGQKSF